MHVTLSFFERGHMQKYKQKIIRCKSAYAVRDVEDILHLDLHVSSLRHQQGAPAPIGEVERLTLPIFKSGNITAIFLPPAICSTFTSLLRRRVSAMIHENIHWADTDPIRS